MHFSNATKRLVFDRFNTVSNVVIGPDTAYMVVTTSRRQLRGESNATGLCDAGESLPRQSKVPRDHLTRSVSELSLGRVVP